MLFTWSLQKNSMFRHVYSRGRAVACRYLVLYARPNDTGVNRLGISVSKKVGGAVVRNRVKRRIKESYRLTEPGMEAGYDIVIVARAAAGLLPPDTAFGEINRSLSYLLKKQELLKGTGRP